MIDDGELRLYLICGPSAFSSTAEWRRSLEGLPSLDRHHWQIQRAIIDATHEIEMRAFHGYCPPQCLSSGLRRLMVWTNRA